MSPNAKTKLTKKRDTQIMAMSRINDYVLSFNADGYDLAEIEVRETLLEQIRAHFEEYQTELEEIDENHEELSKRVDFENMYLKIKSKMHIIRRNSAVPAITREADVRLPKIDLPVFDGNLKAWSNFRDIFESVIHDNKNIPPIQKLIYLKGALTGEASAIIQSIPTSSDNYLIAWKSVVGRYNNVQLLISQHLNTLCSDTVIKKRNSIELRRLISDITQNLSALQMIGLPVDHWDAIIIHMICRRLDQQMRQEWYVLSVEDTKKNEMPTLKRLLDFLETQCLAMESTRTEETDKAKPILNHKGRVLALTVTDCNLCGLQHNGDLFRCEKFKNMNVSERINEVKRARVCFNCLSPKHIVTACQVKHRCKKCSKKHNTLLHFEVNTVSSMPDTMNKENKSQVADPSLSATCALNARVGSSTVLLATASINIKNTMGSWITCRALLDIASQTNLISQRAASILGLTTRPTSISICGINTIQAQSNKEVTITLSSRINRYQKTLDCLIVPTLTDRLPQMLINIDSWGLPSELPLADPQFNVPSDIDVLLGAELFAELMLDGKWKLPRGLPTLQNSILGWIVTGRAEQSFSPTTKNSLCLLTTKQKDEELQQILSKFWTVEEVNLKEAAWSQQERDCEELFVETTTQDTSGRFIVRLPMKEHFMLGSSYELAKNRFLALERKLYQDPILQKRYIEFMKEYESLGHMERTTGSSDDQCYYLPHHAVFRPEQPDKLRVVFDASAKTSNGSSLNDVLLTGPSIQEDLVSIVLRFRTRKFAFAADIIKMYRQVLVHRDHTKYQRILWRENKVTPLQIFELLTVTYGESPSSFLATRCLKRLGEMHKEQYPHEASVIEKDFYMDDVLTGADSVSDIIKLQENLIKLLRTGCFELSKWCSNSSELMQSISENERKNCRTLGKSTEGIKTLGLIWDPSSDVLRCQWPTQESDRRSVTKRKVCSVIASVYDPLGVFTPVVVRAKIFMQRLWSSRLGWDEQLEPSLMSEWSNIHRLLLQIPQLSIPRYILKDSCTNNVQIHGFCDASTAAYGAAVYIRSATNDPERFVSMLLCAKSRVAPLKQLSIPRLELCGAVLLANLVHKVRSALDIPITKVCLWTDSEIVLAWLKDCPTRWKTFIANRVSEIQSLCTEAQWFHVTSDNNPADLLSRGVQHMSNLTSKWWNGPNWLLNDSGQWPADRAPEIKEIPEKRVTVAISLPSDWILSKYSTWGKLYRVVAYIQSFCFNSRQKVCNRLSGGLNVNELKAAQKWCLLEVQKTCFQIELQEIRKKRLPRTSSINLLNPFIDEDGLLRVGGRLLHSGLSFAERCPIILPSNHNVTELIIRHQHVLQLHGGMQTVLSMIRRTYWIIRGRSTVRRVLRDCVRCKSHQKKPGVQQMGHLPAVRLHPSRPFEVTGVDYGGPFNIKQGTPRRSVVTKGYISLFVCMSTKAYHLEVVSDLRTSTFLAALKRFVSRRGLCREIYSDNATTFVGLDNDFKKLIASHSHQEEVCKYATEHGISFNFIPPLAPHQGGLWEAGIKSVKRHLIRVVDETILTLEEFNTILCQVEACLNSRPLSPLSEDPDDHLPLTPGHFLIGGPLMSVPQEEILNPPRNNLDRWRLVQHMTQAFWKRWKTDYLQELQTRNKWRKPYPNLAPGTIVLLKDNTQIPASWSMGRVIEAIPGADGLVRVVKVQTRRGNFNRAIQQIVPLFKE